MARMYPSTFVFRGEGWNTVIVGIKDHSQNAMGDFDYSDNPLMTWGIWGIIRGETVKVRNANSEIGTSWNPKTDRDS